MGLLYPDRATLRPTRPTGISRTPPPPPSRADCLRPCGRATPKPPQTAESLLYPDRMPWESSTRYRGGGDPPKTAGAAPRKPSSCEYVDLRQWQQPIGAASYAAQPIGVASYAAPAAAPASTPPISKQYCTGFVPPPRAARSQQQQRCPPRGRSPNLPRGQEAQAEASAAQKVSEQAETIGALRTQVAALTALLNTGVAIDLDEVVDGSGGAGSARLHVFFGAGPSTAASGWQWRVGIDEDCKDALR